MKSWYWILALTPALLPAQQKSDLQQILDRMDRLEQENHNLAAEVRALREELSGARPHLRREIVILLLQPVHSFEDLLQIRLLLCGQQRRR